MPRALRHGQVKVPRDPAGFPQAYLLLNISPHKAERALSILAPSHPLVDSVVGAVSANVNLAILPTVGARSVLEAVVPPALVNIAVLDFGSGREELRIQSAKRYDLVLNVTTYCTSCRGRDAYSSSMSRCICRPCYTWPCHGRRATRENVSVSTAESLHIKKRTYPLKLTLSFFHSPSYSLPLSATNVP